MVLLSLMACRGVYYSEDFGWETEIFEQVLPTWASNGGTGLLYERVATVPLTVKPWADTAGAYALLFVDEGLDADLLPVDAEGVVLVGLTDENATAERLPPPPLPYTTAEEMADGLAEQPFLPTVTPGHLALVAEGELYRFDGDAWSTETLPPEVIGAPCRGVGPERAVFDGPFGELWVVEDGALTEFAALPGTDPGLLVPLGWGPFDGERVRYVSLPQGDACTGTLDLATGVPAEDGCLDLGPELELRSGVTGSIDQVFLTIAPPAQGIGSTMLVRAGSDGVEVLGHPVGFVRAYPMAVDDPQTDFAVLQPPTMAGGAHGELVLPDGSWDWVRDPAGVVQPAAECPCDEDDPVDVCWCLPRTLDADLARHVTPFEHWEIVAEIHDARFFVWASRRVHDPSQTTTADPTFELEPFDPDRIDVTIDVAVEAPGWPGQYADLSECLTVTDETGAELLPEPDGGYAVDAFLDYTLVYADCQPPDGGPPLLPVTAEAPAGNTDAFGLIGATLGRGWPLDPASDPPELVAGPGLLVVHETSGWTALTVDGAGIRRTPVSGNAAPRVLPDGFLLVEGGDVVDPTTGAVLDTVLLDVDPTDTRVLGPGLLVEDTVDRLVVQDLGSVPVTVLLDEAGPRSHTLLDVSDDGATLLETDGTTVRLRRPGVGEVALVDAEYGVGRAHLDASGSMAVVSRELAVTLVQTYTAHSVDASLALQTRELCVECTPGWAFDRATGAVLAPRPGGGGLTIHRPTGDPGALDWAFTASDVFEGYVDPRYPAGVGRHTTDAYGWAWYRDELDLVGIDLATEATVTVPGIDPTHEVRADASGLAWFEADSAVWHRITGPGVLEAHHTAVSARPIPISQGRAAQIVLADDNLQVGDWLPGEPGLTGALEVTRDVQPVVPADISEPVFADAPCVPYALGPQPAGVDIATWACVR